MRRWNSGLLVALFSALFAWFLLRHGLSYLALIHVDLPSFYAASVQVFRNGASPYDPVQLALVNGPDLDTFPWLYPPTSLFAFFPLAFFTYPQAQTAMVYLNHALLLVLVWVLPLGVCKLEPPLRPWAIAACLSYTLLFDPIFVTLYNGQTNLVLLGSLVAFWLASRSGRFVLASIFLALAILLKTYPLVLLPLLFLIDQRRVALLTGLWLGVLVLLSLLVLPSGLWSEWLTRVVPSGSFTSTPEGLFSPAAIWNQSLNGVFARLLTKSEWSEPVVNSPWLAKALTWLSAGIIAAATAFMAWRSRAQVDRLDRVMVIMLPAMFLIAPLSWEHHLVYVLPTILVLLTSTVRQVRWLVVLAAIALAPERLLELKAFAVLLLWGLALFVVHSKKEPLLQTSPCEAGRGRPQAG